MVDLLRQEGELFEQGVTCPIKDMTDATCLACPMKRDHGTPEGKLCRVGQEQERVGTVALAKRHLGG